LHFTPIAKKATLQGLTLFADPRHNCKFEIESKLLSDMYCESIGLLKNSLRLTPGPAFLFLTARHREALAGSTGVPRRKVGVKPAAPAPVTLTGFLGVKRS